MVAPTFHKLTILFTNKNGGSMSETLKYRIANAVLLVLMAVLTAGCWAC